jgi:hypothetical protein
MTQEEQLASIANASLAQTQAVLDLKTSLTELVTDATNQFNATIARVNAMASVENIADLDKVISNLAQSAIDLKQDELVSGENLSTINGLSLLGGLPLVIERSATSLNRILYDDRHNLRTATSQVDDSTVVEGLGLFMWANSKEEPDDDETCFNTTNGQWLLQVPSWDLIDSWNLHDASFTEDWHEDEANRFAAYLLNNK